MRTPEQEAAIRARSRELRERAGAGEWPAHGKPGQPLTRWSLSGVWAETGLEQRRRLLQGRLWMRWYARKWLRGEP